MIRKYTKWGFPVYVGIITDDNLDHLDKIVLSFFSLEKNVARWKSESLQDKRNLAGELSDCLCEHYEGTEGVAITFYIDKAVISSLFGDFMNHAMCRQEYYFLLGMSTGV